jgi:glycosyltransferase involved in cell wall biosynthesis
MERMRPWYLRKIYFPLVPGSKPDYFSNCWNFPDFSPSRLQHTRDFAIIFLPMNDWHTRIQRTQHLARDLAQRGFPVIYVNPHLGREFPELFRKSESERLLQIAENLLELHVHLPREPVFHHRLLTTGESARIALAIQNTLAQAGIRRAVQILAFPLWLDAAVAIREAIGAPLVYDCHDYLPGFSNIAAPIIQRELDLFRASDLILCTSGVLMERAASLASAPRVLLRNAAAAGFFEAKPTQPTSEITIGYAGALDSWFDTEAVRLAAEARPQWRFELIGRVESAAVSALSTLPNVHLAGEVPFAELPPRVRSFTVAMIPFLLNPLIEATDPIKAYEYLACGLPVVASAMPELERFGERILVYRAPADLLAKLDMAVAQSGPDQAEPRRELVAAETWQARGAELAGLVSRLNLLR